MINKIIKFKNIQKTKILNGLFKSKNFYGEFLTVFLIISEKIIPDLICLCNHFIKELELENLVTIQMHTVLEFKKISVQMIFRNTTTGEDIYRGC